MQELYIQAGGKYDPSVSLPSKKRLDSANPSLDTLGRQIVAREMDRFFIRPLLQSGGRAQKLAQPPGLTFKFEIPRSVFFSPFHHPPPPPPHHLTRANAVRDLFHN